MKSNAVCNRSANDGPVAFRVACCNLRAQTKRLWFPRWKSKLLKGMSLKPKQADVASGRLVEESGG